MEKKKVIAPMIVAILTLAVLVVGATYAYITVTATNNFGTHTITSSVPPMGTVTITGGSNLTMSLTRSQVQKLTSDTTYYASASGTQTSPQTPIIATASVSGQGTFDCTYTLNISSTSNTMATTSVNKGKGLFVLYVYHYTNAGANSTATYDMNDTHNDLHSSNGVNLSGKITGLKQGSNKTITAQLFYKNSTSVDQTALAGTSATYTFKVTAFSCTATD